MKETNSPKFGSLNEKTKNISEDSDSQQENVLKNIEKKSFDLAFLNKVSDKDLVFFARELSVLLDSGVPIVQSLNILSRQMKNPKLGKVVAEIADDIESGNSLSSSLSQYPDIFNKLFVNLVKTGEVSGTLDKSLVYIADQLEKDFILRKKVKGAMTYPIFVVLAMVGVITLLFTFVMPKMLEMLSESGAELPFSTKVLIFTTNMFQNLWWLFLLVIFGGVFFFRYFTSTEAGKIWWDKNKLKIPIMGGILKKVYIERFTRNFAVLVKGGVPVVQGVRVSAGSVGNEWYKTILNNVAEDVENGQALAESLSNYPSEMPDLVTEMIDIGEKTSKIDEILIKIAVFYERESQTAVETLTQLLEPLVMIILGVVVAMIVAGILLPIYNLVGAQ